MKKALYFLIPLLLKSSISLFAQGQKGLDILTPYSTRNFTRSISMPNAYTLAIGEPRYDISNGTVYKQDAGLVKIFTWDGLYWNQKGQDINGKDANDLLGRSVSMSDGNTIAIGAIEQNGSGINPGYARIYRWNGVSWIQKGADINGKNANDKSGYSISMPDSNTVAIGAIGAIGGYGTVRIYKWNGISWIQKGIDIVRNLSFSLGWSVSMPDTNTVAIGALYGNVNNPGFVSIFKWNGNAWIQKGLDLDGMVGGGNTGKPVSMSDSNTVAIGTPRNNGNGPDAGLVRIYKWNGNAWIQKGIDIEGDTANTQLGFSVSMADSNTFAVSSPYGLASSSQVGYVQIYKWNGSTWNQKGINIEGEVIGGSFGTDVSMPDTNVVGIGTRTFIPGMGKITQVFTFCNTLTTSTISPTVCNPYSSPSGNYLWAQSGTYKEVILNNAGCDSVITVNLTVNNTNDTISPIACFNYISPSAKYNWINSGTYNDTIPNSKNCDSIITINLTVKKVDTSVSVLSNSLAANAFSASYQWVDCTNNFTPIVGENNQFFRPTSTGNYAVIVGKNGCTDTSQCYNVIVVGLHENRFSAVRLYPNPTNGKVTIDLGSNNLGVNLKVNSIHGQLVEQIFNVNSKQIALDLSNYSKGIYFVTLQNKENLRVIKLVKS